MILITGAAGNLGSILARYLLAREVGPLKLMIHRRDVPPDLKVPGRTEIARADLARRETLAPALENVQVIIHFAGVLFKSRPERFLPVTNTQYFKNLTDEARARGISKIILVSFPHVEGPTSFDRPARGRLDAKPVSVHAQTRLEEEKYLLSQMPKPVVLRAGMVYGRGILMIEGARWLARRHLLAVWREPTQIHLISTEDFCAACAAAATTESASGIYHIGDEGRNTLQEFLNAACRQWQLKPPWILPSKLIYSAAAACELYSGITGSVSPLTRDFIDIGRVSYYGDTARFRKELLPTLKYRTLTEGLHTL